MDSNLSPHAAVFQPQSARIENPLESSSTNMSDKGDAQDRTKKRKRPKMRTPAQVLSRAVSMSCKEKDVEQGLGAFNAFLVDYPDVAIPNQVFNSLIALCSGMGSMASGAPPGRGEKKDRGDSKNDKSHNHRKPPNERDSAEETTTTTPSSSSSSPSSTTPGNSDHADAGETAKPLPPDASKVREYQDRAFDLYRRAAAQEGVKLQEAAYTSLIRICAARDDGSEARRLLNELRAQGEQPRLRTFTPILMAYTNCNDSTSAFTLYDEMLQDGLDLTEREYMLLIRVATVCKEWDRGTVIIRSFAEDVLRPERRNWDVLVAWFEADSSRSSNSEPWIATMDAPMDLKQGVCGACGTKLRSIDLSEEHRQRMLEQVAGLAGAGGEKSCKAWKCFTDWLSRRRDKQAANQVTGMDVIIDGANVGYYKQNFAGAPKHVDYEQIDQIIRHFEAAGKQVMLFLHKRHLFEQNLPAKYRHIVDRWREQKVMYNTPVGSNDDWYWLYAALWLGGSVQLVTNDEMRDHHFQMLSHRDFQRWKERHQVHFEFSREGIRGHREVVTYAPPAYSVRMQEDSKGKAWHVPALLEDQSPLGTDFVTESKPVLPESVRWICFRRDCHIRTAITPTRGLAKTLERSNLDSPRAKTSEPS